MKVVASNCGCCAIKHVRDFPKHPDQPVYVEIDGHDDDQSSSSPPAYDSWLYEGGLEAAMPAGDAFRAIVAQIKRRRPAGIITLNLTADSESDEYYCCEDCNGPRSEWKALQGEPRYDEEQVKAWSPILEELGFSCQTVLNSNSGNRIHHYTLVYDEGNWEA